MSVSRSARARAVDLPASSATARTFFDLAARFAACARESETSAQTTSSIASLRPR